MVLGDCGQVSKGPKKERKNETMDTPVAVRQRKVDDDYCILAFIFFIRVSSVNSDGRRDFTKNACSLLFRLILFDNRG